METFSALLAICAGNSAGSGESQGQLRGVLTFSLIYAWINGWVKSREAGDLRRHCARYGVAVMGFCNHPIIHSRIRTPRKLFHAQAFRIRIRIPHFNKINHAHLTSWLIRANPINTHTRGHTLRCIYTYIFVRLRWFNSTIITMKFRCR